MPSPLTPILSALQPLQQLAQSEQVTSLVRRANAVTPLVLDKLPPVAAQPLRMVISLVDDFVGISEEEAAEAVSDIRESAEAQAEPSTPALPFPIDAYDGLNAQNARARIQELHDVEAVATVVAYERENKNRSSVLGVAEEWLNELRSGTVPTT